MKEETFIIVVGAIEVKYKYMNNVLNISKALMDLAIYNGDTVIDATVGNGNDTLYMANLIGDEGKVYGFDIQKTAINRTKQALEKAGFNNRVTLINSGHETMDEYVKEKVKLVVFNLGFLPKGDKKITTLPGTTIMAMEKSLKLLVDNGLLLIISYIGHSGGLEEKEAVENYLKELNQKEYNVLKYKFINQINNPPILYGVEKRSFKEG
ncbi:MAG TPA: class I SAM-dependent methyltransferase [Tissierellales bacterium]|nr:class I SAM-dependent methyltransferase [Tissierellales bacterium]